MLPLLCVCTLFFGSIKRIPERVAYIERPRPAGFLAIAMPTAEIGLFFLVL